MESPSVTPCCHFLCEAISCFLPGLLMKGNKYASCECFSLIFFGSEGVLTNLQGKVNRQSGQQLVADVQHGKRFLEGVTAQWLHTNL